MNNKYSVLVLDDDPVHGDLLRTYLEATSIYFVDVAQYAEDFWELLKRKYYDIMFLDYKIHGTTGLEILARLSKKNNKIPIVMMTGEGNQRIAAKAIQLGAVEYLIKGEYALSNLPTLIQKVVQMHNLQEAVERSTEKDQFHSLILNNIRDAVVVWDLDKKITFWNQAAYLLFGWTATERLGKSVVETYFGTFHPPVRIPSAEDSITSEMERQFFKRSGEMIWVSSRITPLRDPQRDNTLIGYMDVSRNITHRKFEQQSLRESEARYRAIVDDHQTELICRFLENTILTFVNETFCQYFNKQRDQLLGTPLLSLIAPEDLLNVKAELAKLNLEKPVNTYEHRVLMPKGEIRWLEWTDRAIFDEIGSFTEFQSVGRDITERKKMEAQLQTAQTRLAQAARLAAVGELASGVAHHINNPLTTIIGEAQILRQQMDPDLPEKESLADIEAAGWRAQQVVQQLLEFSQPTPDTLEHLSINRTIEKALLLIGDQIQAMGILLQVNFFENLPAFYGNHHQLVDLWVNLLLLAREATNDGESHFITIQTSVNPENAIVIEISDNGKPIPGEELEKIFEPHLISSANNRGTGMEFSICREIVRQNKGQISVSSDGQTTTFIVIFPVEDQSYGIG